MKIFKEYLEASGNSALDVDNLPNSELDELLAKFYALVSVLLTNQMTRIFKIWYIKQILTAYSGHGWNYRPSVISKTILCPSASLQGIVWSLRSPWDYNFNHAPHSSQYLYTGSHLSSVLSDTFPQWFEDTIKGFNTIWCSCLSQRSQSQGCDSSYFLLVINETCDEGKEMQESIHRKGETRKWIQQYWTIFW